ncbi:MAG: hypothetical protein ACREBE_07960 [bacterium]
MGCASGGPRQYGQYNDLSPKVAPEKGERLPQHVTVQLARPANVAVFLVMPGRGSVLLFPTDSAQSGYMEAGPHLVETSYRRVALSDSSRLVRRPQDQPQGQRGQLPGGRGRGTASMRDSFPTFGFNQRGYLLVYASQEPLPYGVLSTRVSGISIPIEDADALNTVTKLIRSTTATTGPWAAYATDYPP